MIHDPEIEVTCDGTDCEESVYLSMWWTTGGYNRTDDSIDNLLVADHNWLVKGDSHYCEHCKTDQS